MRTEPSLSTGLKLSIGLEIGYGLRMILENSLELKQEIVIEMMIIHIIASLTITPPYLLRKLLSIHTIAPMNYQALL